MAFTGMDIEQVNSAGHQLQSQAGQIGELIAAIDSTVARLTSVWQGKDATQFVNDWWPEHKRALNSAKDSVHGLGQSALNNASEQTDVSNH